MNEIIDEYLNIEEMIYEIRGIQVMLDRDLAKLYNVETKVFMQSVKRNIIRFPKHYMFQLTKEEFYNWRSQFVTSKNDKIGLRRAPYAFTEQGIAMLASILHSEIAIKTSIKIIDAFVTMRKYISTNLIEQKFINNKVLEHDESFKIVYKDIKLLQESFDRLEEKKLVNEIYFEGQIYDAYSKIKEIVESAKEELIIIDGYADYITLNIIRNLNIKVILIIKNNSKLSKLDIEKYNKQYHNLKVIYNNTFHDRYFIIDKSIIYHSGTSINHAGSKIFSINILEDEFVKDNLIKHIERYI